MFYRTAEAVATAIIILYTAVIVLFVNTGPFTWSFPMLDIKVVDADLPINILFGAVVVRGILWAGRSRERVFAAITVFASTGLALAGFEIYFRAANSYSAEDVDASRFNNPSADFTFSRRGPALTDFSGKKKRVMIQGDSITWGQGIPSWRQTYPSILGEKLGENTDVIAIADPGMEMDWHAAQAKALLPEIRPDTLVYQWYVNDIELSKSGRPAPPLWRQSRLVRTITRHSRVAELVDAKMELLLSNPGKKYAEYIRRKYTGDSHDWYRFENQFHSWGMWAKANAARRILLLYPVVPYSGEYPYADVTERVKQLAGIHRFTIPAVYMKHDSGSETAEPGTATGKGWFAPAGIQTGAIIYGPYIPFAEGKYEAVFRLKRGEAESEKTIARIDIVAELGKLVLAEKILRAGDFPAENMWVELPLEFKVSTKILQGVEFRVYGENNADLTIDSIAIELDYRLETLDLAPYLNGMDTHVAFDDAHPNAKTHARIAEILADKIRANPESQDEG